MLRRCLSYRVIANRSAYILILSHVTSLELTRVSLSNYDGLLTRHTGARRFRRTRRKGEWVPIKPTLHCRH